MVAPALVLVGATLSFAAGLAFGVPLGSAAHLDGTVETVTVVFVALPGVLVGAGVGARTRRHLSSATKE